MECVICKNGKTKPGFVTFTLDRDATIIVFKNVPAFICENCGDYYITSEITQLLLQKADQTILKGVEFEIINFSNAA